MKKVWDDDGDGGDQRAWKEEQEDWNKSHKCILSNVLPLEVEEQVIHSLTYSLLFFLVSSLLQPSFQHGGPGWEFSWLNTHTRSFTYTHIHLVHYSCPFLIFLCKTWSPRLNLAWTSVQDQGLAEFLEFLWVIFYLVIFLEILGI